MNEPTLDEVLAQARRVTTAPSVLAALATHESPEVQRTVAGNPSTPSEVLLDALLAGWTEVVLANPTLDLLLLERPDLMESLGGLQQECVAASPQCPVGWGERVLQDAAADDEVQLALVLNPVFSQDLRQRAFCAREPGWKAERTEALRAALGEDFWSLVTRADHDESAGRPVDLSLKEEELRRLAERGSLGKWLAVRQPGCPPEILEEESRHPDPLRRAGVARHPRAPAALVRRLADDDDHRVRAAVALSAALESDVGVALALDPSLVVQAALVSRASLAEEVIQAIARGGTGNGRELLARRSDLSLEVQLALARDESVRVRHDLASHAQLPLEVVQVLARDRAKSVRGAVAMSGAAPLALVEQLALDPERDVAEMARFALKRRR